MPRQQYDWVTIEYAKSYFEVEIDRHYGYAYSVYLIDAKLDLYPLLSEETISVMESLALEALDDLENEEAVNDSWKYDWDGEDISKGGE